MKKITLLLLPLLFLVIFSSLGEGTRELMPNAGDPTCIQIWDDGTNPQASRNSFTYWSYAHICSTYQKHDS